jgi:hypothetical protein
MPRKKTPVVVKTSRRRFTEEFKQEAVQMLLDGHSPTSVAERLGLASGGVACSDRGLKCGVPCLPFWASMRALTRLPY